MTSTSKKSRRCTVAIASTALVLGGAMSTMTTLLFFPPLRAHGFGDCCRSSSRIGVVVPDGSVFSSRESMAWSSSSSSSSSFVRLRSRRPRVSHRSDATVSMHMGHSRSHNHHHHHHHHDRHRSTKTAKRGAIAIPGGAGGGKLLLLSGRRAVRILFAAMITLLPPFLKRHGISKVDVGAFVLTSGLLAIFDSIRDEVKALISKGESWRVSWLKHSTPMSADYFFRNDNAADRVTFLGIVINLLLSSGKFVVGISCHSSALVADAGHSLSDLFSDFVTLWAVQVARLPPDDDHHYGHGKFESVGSLFLSLTLLGTGLTVGVSSYMKFLRVINAQRSIGAAAAAKLVEIPTWPALVVAGLSIASKEWLYRITRRVGESLNSQVVIANAWHHRSDAYSSVLALISIGLAMAVPKFLAADPAAGILVAGMIAMTGAEIMGESVKQLTDAMTDEELVRDVEARASDDADVRRVTRVRARQVGSSALVDVEVEVPPELSASAMRAIEERIRVRIVSEVNGVLGVDIKATGSDVVFCPLLTAIEDSDAEHHISATEVEMAAREILRADPDVWGRSRLQNDGGGIEEIEFRVYPDGRVTEIVRGVRGKNCQDITEAINKQLGNVVASQPTEEFFEEEVLVQTTLEQKVEGWDGASSW
ncbi:hypothetical protein ACHAW5_009866 [Stephanodiscus triporus]|uniref:Cation efflux protein cytoplasmic domain-containing protein n=1 Tax=Stephanodiscus triporus TaxID=2934178 RepID=A0ABD3QJC4_9STRA